MAVLVLVGSYLVLLPLIEPDQRARAEDAAPIAFIVGALLGSATWIVDRIRPHTFKRLRSRAIGPPILLAVGILILTSEALLFHLFIGVAGFVLPVATPLARFPPIVNNEANVDKWSDGSEDSQT